MSSIFDKVGSALEAGAKGAVDNLLTPKTSSAPSQAFAATMSSPSPSWEKYALPAAGMVAAVVVLSLVLRKK
jgi:hypothetical protein